VGNLAVIADWLYFGDFDLASNRVKWLARDQNVLAILMPERIEMDRNRLNLIKIDQNR
jgi:hypothetical protein